MKLSNVLKTINKVVLVASGVASVVSIAAVAATVIITRDKEETIEDMVRRIHNQEASKLGFEDIEVTFNESDGYLASCKYMVWKNMFTITGVERAERIDYNINNISKLVNSMFITKKARRKGAEYVILHTVRHELRHAWQTVHNKEILMQGNMFSNINDSYKGYGARPEEADANRYAEEAEVGMFNLVLEACTHNQNMASKSIVEKEDLLKSQRISKGLLKLNFTLLFK